MQTLHQCFEFSIDAQRNGLERNNPSYSQYTGVLKLFMHVARPQYNFTNATIVAHAQSTNESNIR